MPLPNNRHCEDPGLDPGDAAIQSSFALRSGLLRSARNDENIPVIPDLIGDPAYFWLGKKKLDPRFRGNDGTATLAIGVEI